jgi:hypothetical protein
MWMHAPAACLNLKLVCGLPSLQGTDSSPWAHHRRGSKLAGRANIFFPHAVLLEYDFAGCSNSAVLPAVRCPLQIGASCRSALLAR